MTDQVRIGDDGRLEIERTWDGEPLWSVETQQDELFAGDAFQQMPGQLPIEEPLKVGDAVTRCGFPGTVIREYMPNMYEIRLASGMVVVPSEELERS